MESPEVTELDYSKVPHIGGVPRYMYRSCLSALRKSIGAHINGDEVAAFEHELWLWFFAGILRQRLKDRKRGISSDDAPLDEDISESRAFALTLAKERSGNARGDSISDRTAKILEAE
jgi:hypothetical protein